MCRAHMAGRLDRPGTVHYVVIWQRTHRYLRYTFRSLHTPARMMWHHALGAAPVFAHERFFSRLQFALVCVCVCVCMYDRVR